MYNPRKARRLLSSIRMLTLFFIVALIVSGLTAFPLETELKLTSNLLGISEGADPDQYSGFRNFISYLYQGVSETNKEYPFLAYGTDWLAFAHLIIAIAFIGVYLDPVRNLWIVYWGMIACIAVIPLALICGHVRQIPFYWQLVDCSFGVFGIIPLLIMKSLIRKLEKTVS